MLHDWQKVQESPVFRHGFKPMKGHDNYYDMPSEHAEVQRKREEAERMAEVAAH